MGGCSGKQDKEDQNNDESSAIPEIYYLYRELGRVLYITSRGVKKTDLKSKMDLPKDSAVCWLNNKKFLVVGGTKNSEPLVSVYLADPQSRSITALGSLPFPVFGGELHEHGSWVYFIGGLCKVGSGVESSPILRFSLSQNEWQVFNENLVQEERKEGGSITSSLRSRRDFKLKNLHNAGTCLIGNKIYFVEFFCFLLWIFSFKVTLSCHFSYFCLVLFLFCF